MGHAKRTRMEESIVLTLAMPGAACAIACHASRMILISCGHAKLGNIGDGMDAAAPSQTCEFSRRTAETHRLPRTRADPARSGLNICSGLLNGPWQILKRAVGLLELARLRRYYLLFLSREIYTISLGSRLRLPFRTIIWEYHHIRKITKGLS